MTPTTLWDCPICRGQAAFYCEKSGNGRQWAIHRCGKCGHGFVASPPAPLELKSMYAGESHHDMATSSLRTPESRRDCLSLVGGLARSTRERGKALDIGSGSGSFSLQLAREIPGNHDMWVFDYLPKEIGLSIHREPITREFAGKRFYLAHGDGLGPGDKGYKFIKQVFASGKRW